MKVRLLASTAAVAWLCSFAPASAAKVCAYAMPVEMVSTVDSRSARSGGDFAFRVTKPMTLDDGTEVDAGTDGFGIVRSASAAGRRNHDGSIALEPRYLLVRKPKGGLKRLEITMDPTLPVVWSPSEPMLNKAMSHVPLPVPGLVMTGVNQFRWGRNIILGPGFTFTVIPVGNLERGPVC